MKPKIMRRVCRLGGYKHADLKEKIEKRTRMSNENDTRRY